MKAALVPFLQKYKSGVGGRSWSICWSALGGLCNVTPAARYAHQKL